MANLVNPFYILLIDLVFWFLAFDIAENYNFPLLNLILFGAAIGTLLAFIYDIFDLTKSSVDTGD